MERVKEGGSEGGGKVILYTCRCHPIPFCWRDRVKVGQAE